MASLLLLLFLLSSSTAAAAKLNFVPASSETLVKFVGRRIPAASGTGGFSFDWEHCFAQVRIANATIVNVVISDQTKSGAKFAVFFDNTNTSSSTITSSSSSSSSSLDASGDPNAYGNVAPNLRISSFLTSPGSEIRYMLASRASIEQETATYTVQLLTEPNFIGDSNESTVLTLDGFESDGIFLPAPAYSNRRIEILGDSLTAGYGSGFDAPVIGGVTQPCGAGTIINDVANSYGALLCANFSADCTIEAVSGVTLFAGHPNLPELWTYELGSMYGNNGWPDKVPYNASRFVPQALIINLGENDWNANCGNSSSCIAEYTAAYVAFVQRISTTYNDEAAKSITFFLTIAPHEKGQSKGILPTIANLTASGYKAIFLNATVDEALYPKGCGGHPGPTVHQFAFERAQPVIAAAMGWN